MHTAFTSENPLKHCPIEVTLQYIGKKWSVQLVRDMMLGKRRFRDFLQANPRLSTKVLSERLKELEVNGILEKRFDDSDHGQAEYVLTNKGDALGRILRELALFSIRFHPDQVLGHASQREAEAYIESVLGCPPKAHVKS